MGERERERESRVLLGAGRREERGANDKNRVRKRDYVREGG